MEATAMRGLSINKDETDKELYFDLYVKTKKEDEIKFRPGDLVMALCSPKGVSGIDLNGTILIVKFVALELDRDDGLQEDEEQPEDLPYYLCKSANGDEYLFVTSELMSITTDQETCILKEGMLNGYLPTRWSFDLYDKWL